MVKKKILVFAFFFLSITFFNLFVDNRISIFAAQENENVKSKSFNIFVTIANISMELQTVNGNESYTEWNIGTVSSSSSITMTAAEAVKVSLDSNGVEIIDIFTSVDTSGWEPVTPKGSSELNPNEFVLEVGALTSKPTDSSDIQLSMVAPQAITRVAHTPVVSIKKSDTDHAWLVFRLKTADAYTTKDEQIGIRVEALIGGLNEPSDSDTGYLNGLPNEDCNPPVALVDTSNPDITVGNGTPASCTESAFKEALLQVPEGGIITFSCGDEPAKITLTSQAEVTKQMTIDGNGLITLSGEGNTRILKIYDGNFSYWNQNGAYPTITLQRLIFKEGNSEGSSEGLYWTEKNYVGTGRQVFFDLFGYDGPSYHYEAAGGAVYSQFANVNIIKCLFENNKCPQWGPDLAGGGYYGFGGNTTATIVSSIFRNNTCANGGAIGALQANLKIYNTLVEDNQALGLGGNDGAGDTQIGNGGNGGGILSDGVDQYHHFCGVVVRNNTANSLGGGFFRTNNHDEATQVIEKSSFDYNVVNSHPVMQLDGTTNNSGRGGMFIGGMGYLNITITDTSISHNEGDLFAGASFGGGEGQHIIFANLKINYNNARRAHGAGLFLSNPISGTISNSEFRGNTAIYDDGNPNTWLDGFAGAVSGYGAESITIVNTSFIDNQGAEFFTQSCQFPFIDGGGNYQTPYDGSAGWCDGSKFMINDKLCSANIMCEGNILCSSLIPSDEEACSGVNSK